MAEINEVNEVNEVNELDLYDIISVCLKNKLICMKMNLSLSKFI